MRPRIDQHGLVIHNGVSIMRRTVSVRYVIISDTGIRQDYANTDRFAIMKRRMVLFDYISLEARSLIDAEYAGYPASDGPDGPTNHGADRARCSITFARAVFHTSNHTLGHG
jgi:hypothetical protein